MYIKLLLNGNLEAFKFLNSIYTYHFSELDFMYTIRTIIPLSTMNDKYYLNLEKNLIEIIKYLFNKYSHYINEKTISYLDQYILSFYTRQLDYNKELFNLIYNSKYIKLLKNTNSFQKHLLSFKESLNHTYCSRNNETCWCNHVKFLKNILNNKRDIYYVFYSLCKKNHIIMAWELYEHFKNTTLEIDVTINNHDLFYSICLILKKTKNII